MSFLGLCLLLPSVIFAGSAPMKVGRTTVPVPSSDALMRFCSSDGQTILRLCPISPHPLTCSRIFPASLLLPFLPFVFFASASISGLAKPRLCCRYEGAKEVRGALLGRDPQLRLVTGDVLRLAPEYRYLGVIQTPRDTGRRDTELSAQRAQTAWTNARGLLASPSLPWALKQAWFTGRVLPAAYATLATNLAVSARATAPLAGFFEKAARNLLQSWPWQLGHLVTRPVVLILLGQSSPEHAVLIARARLVLQLLAKAPPAVWDIFEAAWNRDTPWCQLLVDSCRQLLPSIRSPSGARIPHCTVSALKLHQQALARSARFLSRWGTAQAASCALWQDVCQPRARRVIGQFQTCICQLCQASLPSKQALAVHIHRKHSVVSCYIKFTHGTGCLWCNTDMHSTDRLKYHLRTTAACLHGLRVQVGEVYTYGTGTKRVGRRRHVGLPALRLPGPLNATPAQRLAALEGRVCTAQELADELRAATGATDVHAWPAAESTSPVPSPPASVEPSAPLPPSYTSEGSGQGTGCDTGRWFRIVPASQAARADEEALSWGSPLWSQLIWERPSLGTAGRVACVLEVLGSLRGQRRLG